MRSSTHNYVSYCCCFPINIALLILVSAVLPLDEGIGDGDREGRWEENLNQEQLQEKDPISKPSSPTSGLVGQALPAALPPTPYRVLTTAFHAIVLLLLAATLVTWRGLRVGALWIVTNVTQSRKGTRNSGIGA